MRVLVVTDVQADKTNPSFWNVQGLTGEQRVQALINAINIENERCKLDAVINLGDMVWNDASYLSTIKSIYYDKLTMPIYFVHGNHDTCPASTWLSLFGYEKNYSFQIGDTAFIVVDNWGTEASPAYTYSTINTTWLQTEINKYTSCTNLFLLSHYIDYDTEGSGLITILSATANFKGVLWGHMHNYSISTVLSKPHIMPGHFSTQETWDNAYPWGFGILEITASGMFYANIYVEHEYSDYTQERILVSPTWLSGELTTLTNAKLYAPDHGGYLDVAGKVYVNGSWQTITNIKAYKNSAWQTIV